MAINAFPIATVPPAANLITNNPAGIVTATDVQTAINQLASAIPSPGSGTDPLFLTLGLNVNVTNPTIGNPNSRTAANFNAAFDCSNIHPDFTNAQTLGLTAIGLHGQATYGATTQVKESFYGLNASAYYAGSGQKFMFAGRIDAFGMSDTAMWGGQNVNFCGGPVNGDEGQGWALVSNLGQRATIFTYAITAKPTQATLTTTTTQAITRSENAQTVTVASGAGASIGDWVVIDQELPNAGQNLEAVQLTGVGPTSITGVFRCNHLIGATIKPALVFTLDGTFGLGQDRVLVNLSQASYSTGTVSAISGGGFTGSGTAWSNTMVGGNALNIGAVTLASDDYTLSPFDAGANRLRSWYQINTVLDATHLGIFRTSVAGDGAYYGFGVSAGPTAYTIRACARILRIVSVGSSFTGQVICENSSSIWNVGDTVEEVMCPYPDVTGFQYAMTCYTPGGTYRGFMGFRNMGPRKFGSFINVDDIISRGAQTDGVAFDSIFSLAAPCKVGMLVSGGPTEAAIRMQSTGAAGAVVWGTGTLTTSAAFFLSATNGGLTLNTLNGFTAPSGQLVFANSGTGINPETNQVLMLWNGYLKIPVGGSGNQMIQLDNALDAVNFEYGFLRWKSSVLELGTEKGGTGSARDVILKTNGVEQIRCVAGDTVRFSAAPSFTANGSVATALSSVGPPGASTTVQKWLTIRDNTNTLRYIPCF